MLDSDTLRKVQIVELMGLVEIDRICKKHSIDYFMVGGTLLGAVRHDGFVPWDDDADVAMFREDFEKFIRVCRNELGEEFFLQTVETQSSFNMSVAKVRVNNTQLIDDLTQHLDIHQGVYVDIFPLDNVPRPSGLGLFIQAKVLRCLFALRAAKLGTSKPVGMVKRLLKGLVKRFGFLFPVPWINKAIHSVMTWHSDKETDYVVSFCCHYGYRKQTMKKSVYKEPINLKFEGCFFSAPREWDFFLTKVFGDYRKLPSEDKRTTVHEFIHVDLGRYEKSIEKVTSKQYS